MARTGPASDSHSRRQRGAYYTPAPLARHILQLAVEPLLRAPRDGPTSPIPRVLDPACGAGVFLVEAASLLAESRADEQPKSAAAAIDWRRRLVLEHVFGVDIDRSAVEESRRRIADWVFAGRDPTAVGAAARRRLLSRLEANVVVGNALVDAAESDAPPAPADAPPVDWQASFPRAMGRQGGFDAVVGNPPYINIRLASRTLDADLRAYYRRRYRTARGGYDLYVLFLERGLELLRPGGRYSWIVPNKLAGAAYAKACRELLIGASTLERWEDLSSVAVFADAGVYPHIVAGRRRPAAAGHCVEAVRWRFDSVVEGGPRQWRREAAVSVAAAALSSGGWAMSGGSLQLESRTATVTLGDLAQWHSGATGFQAQRLADELVEAGDACSAADETAAADGHRFITSGNIDRYRVDDGDVRFMRRRFRQPLLPRATPQISENKRRLYDAPKIVVAGMTRRLEAAYDRQSRALGVQVYAAIDWKCDPYYLLGVLNSRLLSHLFRERFAAKRLCGGYLAINKAQLVELPVAWPPPTAEAGAQIAAAARQLEQLHAAGEPAGATSRISRQILRLEAELDAAVYRLYHLTPAEIAEIDASPALAAA